MLILARGIDERVVLYDRETKSVIAEVMVCDVHGRTVKIGFDASDRYAIHRSEVLWEILDDGREP